MNHLASGEDYITYLSQNDRLSPSTGPSQFTLEVLNRSLREGLTELPSTEVVSAPEGQREEMAA
ncbi:MAG: hypothetical protein A2836_02000 [Candidatus Taylorbacteria bacterium RIFCSPHIGHO2_01_FULL_45_63]|uniref:Uncharacterized protein n=1 Tax=Candidatus Taylorbacteria bacterium RIFCSPHIGHO2_02_FULL_45_35 TaxID=1802311 RepID=A0A1G2MWY1_9BACT|nr:MAG: hypothetical protein A2836_02000 [Candidatus Taylorbacteria bacterium RIFCSPHIGHO2_01_FULL_45_63]OHA27451.1 MAG: hypothetical protein A3D56_00645 [Candidatus Taylorbacteria bacterium RIFCSPHIGHO2_02_FULL_45_35]OHA34490.1 MAG: hypothetical protein A3A22_02650 [Candidatus Taylorbacteria bacterium RIFCSPLOWO2_01_FULL_45_34b]